VPAIVVASSDKAYGPSEELPYREEMQLRPASPYEASKAAADAIALSYRPAYGLPVAVTRFANIYGGGDLNFSRLIPEAIAAVLDGRRPQIRSDGSPERDFLYVDDAVSAYLAVEHAVGAGGPAAGEAFNAGGERPYPVSEVLDLITEVSGSGLRPEYLGVGNPAGEIDRQYVDSAKLRELTGWEPVVGLRDGLIRTLDWYRDHSEVRP
jgi:CDP-glucose 4,6-dehydratase